MAVYIVGQINITDAEMFKIYFFREFTIIVYFAIGDQTCAITVLERLIASLKIDDRKSPMGQSSSANSETAFPIRAPV